MWQSLLPPLIQIASINAPSLCVVSGPDAEIACFAESLKGQGIVCRNLHTSHAFHSAMMDPIVELLRAEVEKVHLRPPSHPFVSRTVTGQADKRQTKPPIRILGTARERSRPILEGD